MNMLIKLGPDKFSLSCSAEGFRRADGPVGPGKILAPPATHAAVILLSRAVHLDVLIHFLGTLASSFYYACVFMKRGFCCGS